MMGSAAAGTWAHVAANPEEDHHLADVLAPIHYSKVTLNSNQKFELLTRQV